jgi:hypothetical protein
VDRHRRRLLRAEPRPAGPRRQARALKATATLSNGQAVEVTELAPRNDRDLVLARLAAPAIGIAAVINSRSWQGGCFGAAATETRTGAVSARIDDLGNWVQETVHRPVVQRDFYGDGRSDAMMVYRHADTSIAFYSSLADSAGDFGEFTVGYTVPARSWDWASMKLITGDFNGDRRTDMGMMYRFGDGSIKMFTGLADAAGHIQPFTSSYAVPASAGWDWNAIELP